MDQFQQVFVYNYTQVDMIIPESYKEYIEWNKDDHLITYKFNANKCIKYRTILNLIKSNELTPKPSINDIIWLLCEIYKARLKAEEIGIFLNRISTDDIFLIFPNGFKNEEMKSVVFKYITFRQIHLPCVWMTHVIEETIKLMQQCYQEAELLEFQYFQEWFNQMNRSLQNIEEYISYIKQFQQSSFKIYYSIPISANNIQIHNEQLRSRVQYLQFEADVTQVDCNNTLKLIEMIDQCYTQLEIMKTFKLKCNVDNILHKLMGFLQLKMIFNCDESSNQDKYKAIDLIGELLTKCKSVSPYFIVNYEITAIKLSLENIIMRGIQNTRNNYLITLYLVLNKEIIRLLYLQQQPTLIQVQQFYNDCLNNSDNQEANKLQRLAEGIKIPTCTSISQELSNAMEYKYNELLNQIQDQTLKTLITEDFAELQQNIVLLENWQELVTLPFAFLKINQTEMEQLQVLNEKWQRHLSNNSHLFKQYDKEQIDFSLNELWTSINNQEPLIQNQIEQNNTQESQQNTTINENRQSLPQQTMENEDVQPKCDNTQTQQQQNGQLTTNEELKKCLEPDLYEILMRRTDLTEALLSNMVQRLTLPKKYLSYLGDRLATIFIQVVPNFKVEIDESISTWNKLVVENPKNDIQQDLDMFNNHVKKEIDELFKPAIKEQFVELK